MLNIEQFKDYCSDKTAVTGSFPFDETTLVMKVANKMFALTDLEDDFRITLKAKPEDVIMLTEKYECISGAWHMNKKHWISIQIDGSISDSFIKELIDNSYYLVISGLPKKQQILLKK